METSCFNIFVEFSVVTQSNKEIITKDPLPKKERMKSLQNNPKHVLYLKLKSNIITSIIT